MKVVPLLVLALVACKPDKSAKPAAGSAAPTAAPAPKRTATDAPRIAPQYTAPSAPEGEVVPAQAGSAVVPHLVPPHDPMARALDQLDADHDGKVTPAEVKAGKLKIDDPDSLDVNGDGQISKDELAAGFRDQRLRARTGQNR